MLALQNVTGKNTARSKILRYHQNDWELAVVTFSIYSLIPSEGKIMSKVGVCLEYHLKHSAFSVKNDNFFLEKTLEYK